MASVTAILKQMLSGQADSAAKRDFILFKRFCLGKRFCILEFRTDLQPHRFEPELVPNPDDNKSKNEEVKDRL